MNWQLIHPSSVASPGLGFGDRDTQASFVQPPSPTPPERHNLTSTSWIYPRTFTHLEMPKTAQLGGVQKVILVRCIEPLQLALLSSLLWLPLKTLNSSTCQLVWSLPSTCSHRCADLIVKLQLHFRAQLSVHHNKPTQDLHYCRLLFTIELQSQHRFLCHFFYVVQLSVKQLVWVPNLTWLMITWWYWLPDWADWCDVNSNSDHCDEETAKTKSKAFNLWDYLSSSLHRWPWAVCAESTSATTGPEVGYTYIHPILTQNNHTNETVTWEKVRSRSYAVCV